MRFAVCLLAALVCSNIYAQNRIDLSKPPQPPPPTDVFVLNFPDVQGVAGTVSVDNLPAVQTVSGSVAVTNLPAVQPVAGTVNVGNLPLADDGSIRVSAGPAQSPQHVVMYELMPYYTPFSNFVALPSGIDTIGYRAIAFSVSAPGNNIAVQLLWQMTPEDDFRETHGVMPGSGGMSDCGTYGEMFAGRRYICANYGGRPGVVLHQGQSDAATSVRLYLIP